jgi:hypothetical protein
LAQHGHLTADAAAHFAAHGPTRNAPQPWMFTKAPSEDRWRQQLAGQTRLIVTAAQALTEVAAAWAATQDDQRPISRSNRQKSILDPKLISISPQTVRKKSAECRI